jgi:hypothetical protein
MNHLVVPGLLDPLPERGGELRRFPNLELLLARGDEQAAPAGYAQTLFSLFGMPCPDDSDPPTASVCYHAEPGVMPLPDAFLLHADPVHLRPDQDRLLAFDFQHQALTEAEAAQCAQAFNTHFAADGLRLLTPHAQRWYLAATVPPRLRTRPLHDVLGRNVDLFLPEGPDALTWRGWMNELQMLFHALPLNPAREAQGLWPVSGLWFSGGGRLPARRGEGFADYNGGCLLADGLQRLSPARHHAGLRVEHAPGRAVVDASPGDWSHAVSQLDNLLGGYLAGACWLHTCDGRAWYWKPGMRRRLWKRVVPLSQRLGAERQSAVPGGPP